MEKLKGTVAYENVSESYLRKRQLKGGADSFLLWGLGVGAVISGDFYGWNYGLIAGGFWGLAIASLLMAIMYLCMVHCLAELSAALPHTGGLYSFTRNAFGPFWGYVCGVAVAIEYTFACAALVYSMTNYLEPLVNPFVPSFLVWLALYAIFVAVCIHSLELTLNVSLLLTLLAIVILIVFYISMVLSGEFSLHLLFNVPPEPGHSAVWLPHGWRGVFAAIPYGIWFYLAIEILPLASEEANNPPKNIPTALISGIYTLIILSVFTLVLNTGVGSGAVSIGQSQVPLAEGLEAYFGPGSTSDFITALSLTLGLGASLPTQIYGYGRIIFALSRAGYIPRWLSVTGENRTPYRALIFGTVIGILCVQLVDVGSEAVDATILNMAVLAAVISYILVMLSYIKLKFSHPDLARPYKSPWGVSGAIAGTILAVFSLIACLSIPTYQQGIWGVAIVMTIAIAYYLLFGKNRLVAQAPEEAAALEN